MTESKYEIVKQYVVGLVGQPNSTVGGVFTSKEDAQAFIDKTERAENKETILAQEAKDSESEAGDKEENVEKPRKRTTAMGSASA